MLTKGRAIHVVLPDFQVSRIVSSHESLRDSWLGSSRQSALGRSWHDSYSSEEERSPSSLPLLRGIKLGPVWNLRLSITSLLSSSRNTECGRNRGRELLGLAGEREEGRRTTGLIGLRLEDGRLFMASCRGKRSESGILGGLAVSVQSCLVGK